MARGGYESRHSRPSPPVRSSRTPPVRRSRKKVRLAVRGGFALAAVFCLVLGLAVKQAADRATAVATATTLSCTSSSRLVANSTSAGSTLFGVDASNAGALQSATAEFGQMPVIRVFYSGLPPMNAWTKGAVAGNKSAVVTSFNAPPSTILSGSDDAVLTNYFDTAPTGHPIYWNYEHEPEHYVDSGQFTTAQYRAAWAHIGAIAARAGNADLHGTLILTSWTLAPASGRNWKDFYDPGAVSVLGWDDYPPGTIGDHNPQATPPADFVSAEISAARQAGLGVGFAEFALATPAGRPGWLAKVASYFSSHGVLFGTYFNAPGPGQMTDAASIASWRNVVAGSGSDVSEPPSPTSSPPASGPTAGPSSSPSPTPGSSQGGSPRPTVSVSPNASSSTQATPGASGGAPTAGSRAGRHPATRHACGRLGHCKFPTAGAAAKAGAGRRPVHTSANC
jgi:hypothetical protein